MSAEEGMCRERLKEMTQGPDRWRGPHVERAGREGIWRGHIEGRDRGSMLRGTWRGVWRLGVEKGLFSLKMSQEHDHVKAREELK